MARREFVEAVVLDQLKKKADIQLDLNNRTIVELTRKKSKGDVGIKTKGKIDFLTKTKNWRHIFVDSFN